MKLIKITAIWCSACLIMNKRWHNIQDKFNIETISYDLDMNEEEVEKYNVGDTLPVFLFLKEEKEIGRLIGEHTEEEIISYMKGIGINEKTN